jgi:ATP-binding cassette subfamily B protein
LILDEATSALDAYTEKLIQNSLDKLMMNKTVLVIAHRLQTLVHMDRILVFNKGAIAQDGKHYDLVEEDGLYQKLWRG